MTEKNNKFKLPIQYVKHHQLKQNIIEDLDLLNEHLETKPVSKYYLNPKTILGNQMMNEASKYYTTNLKYIKQTTKVIKKIPTDLLNTSFLNTIQNFHEKWNEIKNETSFCEKYLYLDWDPIKFLNSNSQFLQINAIYNLSSPVLSLIMPILMLIFPFIIIKMKGFEVNINEYLNILKTIAGNHAIVKLFTNYKDIDNSQTLYSILTIFFYFFSIYQSILYSIRFYTILNKMNDFYGLLNSFVEQGIESTNWFKNNIQFSEYKEFAIDVEKLSIQLNSIKGKLNSFNSLDINAASLFELGKKWQLFYELFNNSTLTESIENTFSFLGYIDLLIGIKNNAENGKINVCKLSKKCNKNKIEDQYYPVLMNEKHVKNSVELNTNMIISGPNASGKTTILKTTLINIIFSQTYGFGCYKKASFSPFDMFHSYLNIPDTSGRDSLFQAEAKRCKEIIDSVEKYKNKRHFCIIDELYSGTNPIEAINSCTAFMKFMSTKDNINIYLTTHYIELCEKLDDHKKVNNYYMETKILDDRIVFQYKIKKGISNVQGAKYILNDLKYPIDILE